jgi:hypothetical protein
MTQQAGQEKQLGRWLNNNLTQQRDSLCEGVYELTHVNQKKGGKYSRVEVAALSKGSLRMVVTAELAAITSYFL